MDPKDAYLMLPTVEVVHPEGEEHGSVVINSKDFDAATHTLWAERASAKVEEPKKKKSATDAP